MGEPKVISIDLAKGKDKTKEVIIAIGGRGQDIKKTIDIMKSKKILPFDDVKLFNNTKEFTDKVNWDLLNGLPNIVDNRFFFFV